MKISEIKTYLVDAAPPQTGGRQRRNWLFIKITTDEGLYGVGEASGWPRVVETAIEDLACLLIGEDPFNIERLWGKALDLPVWSLLGGKIRERVPVYAHARTAQGARELVDRGFDALKTGGIKNCVEIVEEIRKEVGMGVDLMVDLHGPPWMTTRDAIALGRKLEQYDLLFYEDPVAPEDVEAPARVADAVDIPIAAGERHAYIHGLRELIEREIIDVAQPDTGRFGGLGQMKKLAAIAEAHYVTIAPHDGSLGPVAEMAAVHFLASIPNCLLLEHLEDDVPQRYEVMTGGPHIEQGNITVPDGPGLGVDLVESAIARYPSQGNISTPEATYDYSYVYSRRGRAAWLSKSPTDRPGYLPGSIY